MPIYKLDVIETKIVDVTYTVEAETLQEALTTQYWVKAHQKDERDRMIIRRHLHDFTTFDLAQENE